MGHLGSILIADDEETFRQSTAYLLQQQGYRCDCAADGPEALRMFRRSSYDLLVADIRMPGNNDLTLIRQVQETTGGMPVILVTGYPSVETATRSVPLPVVAYLTKPVGFADLLGHVKAVMDRSRTKRLAEKTLEMVEDCGGRLRELVQNLGGARKLEGRVHLADNLEAATLSLAECCQAVQRLHASIVGEGTPPDACRLHNCSRLKTLESAVQEAIDAIESTKNSFKSKELGNLRHRLQQVLGQPK